jgi:molybdopterin molybdotransferase
MLSVAEAIEAVLQEAAPFAPALLPLSEALGLVLAENIHSDVDSPPFDKSLVDGFAVRLNVLQAELPVLEVVSAGQVPTRSIVEPAAIQIMTGAPIPVGADAVVPVEVTSERTVSDKTRLVSIPVNVASWKPGTNIVRQGASLKRGELVVAAGAELRPQELGVLAELGHATVPVRRRPRVAVLATGDELVPVEQTPGPGQIRNSNETMLCAQIHRAGGEPVPLGIARDEPAHLRERIASGLQADVLVLSGGVSMGDKDLVPSELTASGVRQVFHKVNVKPGKPVWFGVQECRVANGCLVFGLPGNPVSSLVCFELFVRPAMRRLMGFERVEPLAVKARLTQAHTTRGNRPTYHPARLEWLADGAVVTTVLWVGSSDLRGTVAANAMALFPVGDRTFAAGEVVDVIVW